MDSGNTPSGLSGCTYANLLKNQSSLKMTPNQVGDPKIPQFAWVLVCLFLYSSLSLALSVSYLFSSFGAAGRAMSRAVSGSWAPGWYLGADVFCHVDTIVQ